MTIEQTVEIPADRRLHLDIELPQNFPLGTARVAIIDFSAEKELERFKSAAAEFSESPGQPAMAEILKQAEAKAAGPSRRPVSSFYGSMKGAFGDGLEYQRTIRAEWDRKYDASGKTSICF
jgi:hypothetical protein